MKKIIFAFMVMFSSLSLAQSNTTTKIISDSVESVSASENRPESFQETVRPYVEKLMRGLEKGVEYASEEIPIVIKQYVVYRAITSWLIVFLLSFIMIKFYIYCRDKFKDKKSWFYDRGAAFGGVIFTIIGSAVVYIPCGINFFIHIQTAILTTFFPKLFLVKEFINLI